MPEKGDLAGPRLRAGVEAAGAARVGIVKVFLLVMATLGPPYSGDQITPSTIQEMPDMASCEAVAKAARDAAHNRVVVRCVAAEKDYE
jgi:hypothetical protein